MKLLLLPLLPLLPCAPNPHFVGAPSSPVPLIPNASRLKSAPPTALAPPWGPRVPLLPHLPISPSSHLPISSTPPTKSSCQKQDIETLTARLLQDLPSYANRISQSSRLSRTTNIYSYVLVAGRPEFVPLTLGPGIYSPTAPTGEQQPQQVFITTLERQYIAGRPVELQNYHWLFLTRTSSGWQLAITFSRTGSYPAGRPPTPPRDTSNGVVAQAIRNWLRDCAAGP